MSKREVSVLVKPTAAADEATTKAIDSLRSEVQARSFTDGSRLLTGVDLTDGTNRISHGLGRKPKGYLVVGRRNVVATAVAETRIVSPAAFQESIPANLTPPNGGTDYWTFSGTARLAAPLPVSSGETITRVLLYFYRGSGLGNPTIRLLGATTGASATVETPTVAWTNPSADTTWELLFASYSTAVTSATATLDIATGNGSRVRQAIVDVQRTPDTVPELYDLHDVKTDIDTFLYLVADGWTADVDLLVF